MLARQPNTRPQAASGPDASPARVLSQVAAGTARPPRRPNGQHAAPAPDWALPDARQASPESRNATSAAAQLSAERKRLLTDWSIVKGARFNAARRLRHKHDAAQLTFALSGIYGFVVPLFTLQFAGEIGDLNTRLVSFVAACAGALSFIIALHYQWQSFPERSKALHDCGLAINALRKRLKIAALSAPSDLVGYLDEYETILRTCENHDEIDYELSRAERGQTGGPDWRLRLRLAAKTNGLCWAIWTIPVAVGAALWVGFNTG
ncbi:MAG: SLATT domain-containing protein [Pseudomonadota bacterium]